METAISAALSERRRSMRGLQRLSAGDRCGGLGE
jgi:hypothetical protein